MKQLDVNVSPPAFVWNHNLPVTLVTFDLDPVTFALLVNVYPISNGSGDMNYCPVILV